MQSKVPFSILSLRALFTRWVIAVGIQRNDMIRVHALHDASKGILIRVVEGEAQGDVHRSELFRARDGHGKGPEQRDRRNARMGSGRHSGMRRGRG